MNEIIDWNKFKTKAKGANLLSSKKAYIELCELLYNNRHKLLTGYVGNKTKILIDFNCGHEPHWITPNHYKKGIGCPKCSNRCTEQAKENFLSTLNSNSHKLLSNYKNNSIKVLIDFNCGHKPHWVSPNDYKKGIGCPKCSGLCSEQAKRNLLNMLNNNNHKLESKYVNSGTKILINFNCGHSSSWVLPGSYKKGCRCPKCGGTSLEHSKENFLKLVKNNNHKLLSEYITNSIKVLIDFNCGHEPHWITPNCYKRGTRCPKCIYKGETALNDLLVDMFDKVEKQKTFNALKDKSHLRYDFYLPKYNLLIELDGDYHRDKIIYKTNDMTELEKYLEEIKANERLQNAQYRDKLKNDFAKDNNIPLLRIEYSKGKIELDKWKKLIEDKIKEINFR